MKGFASVGVKYFLGLGVAGSMLLSQGCLATRDWVKEQVDPVTGRVSKSEGRLDQIDGQISTLGNRVGGIEGKPTPRPIKRLMRSRICAWSARLSSI